MNNVFVTLYLLAVVVLLPSCESSNSAAIDETTETKVEIKLKNLKYGFDLDRFRVVKKKIRKGDTFSSILEDNGIAYPEVYNILQMYANSKKVT